MIDKPGDLVPSAPIVGVGLVGGYATARYTGVRTLGGAVLLAAGVVAGRTWLAKAGPMTTAGLAAAYLLGFGLSHPLAKKIGAWPSVLGVAAANAGASYALVDRRSETLAGRR